MKTHSYCALLASAILIGSSTSFAVTFTATILQPAGFTDTFGNGASSTRQVGYGSGPATSGLPNALFWNGTAANFVNLHPSGFEASYATGVSNANQVGYGFGTSTNSNIHALLWNGSAESVIDLNPNDFNITYGLGISGTVQVGYGFNTNDFLSHALLWNGSPQSKVDLNPQGYDESFAYAISGNSQTGYSQVGYGYGPTTDSHSHALLWSSTAESSIDLNPADFAESYANAVVRTASGTIEVGSGTGISTGGVTHALMWASTAASMEDLHPNGFDFSEALGVSNAGQVGDGFGSATGGDGHALYWNGNAASAVDLHAYLTGLGHAFVSSTARSIAENGTIVGSATDDNFNSYAVLWIPESGVAGDYNNNGVVDAADYVAWRAGSRPLHNEITTIGDNTPGDYTEWRVRFGGTLTSGAAMSAGSVPEPSSNALVWSALSILCRAISRMPVAQRQCIHITN
jgi:hypothetical protein